MQPRNPRKKEERRNKIKHEEDAQKKKNQMNGPWSAFLHGAYDKVWTTKKVKCEICCRPFANEGNLANHMKSHKKFCNSIKKQKIVFPQLNNENTNEQLEEKLDEEDEEIRMQFPEAAVPKIVGKQWTEARTIWCKFEN